MTPIKIAYDRYVAGLWDSVLGQCIATVVMGLEALLSEGGDNLRYKLAVRVAKILAQFGLNPLTVKNIVEEAYRVRNKFVHGDHITASDQDRLTKRAGDPGQFVAQLLDFLRLCLVVFIATGVEKKRLLRLLDDALVDHARHDELVRLLEPARPLCQPSTQ